MRGSIVVMGVPRLTVRTSPFLAALLMVTATWGLSGEQDTRVSQPASADAGVYAYAYRNWNRANNGKDGTMGAGWHPLGGEKRAYLRFDIIGVTPAQVQRAVLRLYHDQTGGGVGLRLGVHKVTSPWEEGTGTYHSGYTEPSANAGELSWAQQPSFDPTPVDVLVPSQPGSHWLEFDVTGLVRGWAAGEPNCGVVVKAQGLLDSNVPESMYNFLTREHVGQKPPHLAMVLVSPSNTAATPATAGVGPGSAPATSPPDSRTEYQVYIAAYNTLTALMAQGKGDTPEAREAYQQYVKAKEIYEASVKGGTGGITSPTPAPSPSGTSATSPLMLTDADLPPGLKVDPTGNRVDEFGTVQQKLMVGSAPTHVIDVNISTWGPAADGYFNRKHGMIYTGEFEQVPVKIGEMSLYAEQKAGCGKQLVMKTGGRMVEMQRWPAGTLTQAGDPITRDTFLAIARRYESKTGGKGVAATADNPNQFTFGTWVWPVQLKDGRLMVRGPGHSRWGESWVPVADGVSSYTGTGTAHGPVVLWTRDGNLWDIVMLHYTTGARRNPRHFDTPTFIERTGRFGVILRVANKYYDYSWGHLREMFVSGGAIAPAPTTRKEPGWLASKSYKEDQGSPVTDPNADPGEDDEPAWFEDDDWEKLGDEDDPVAVSAKQFSVSEPQALAWLADDPPDIGIRAEGHTGDEMIPMQADVLVLDYGERVPISLIRKTTVETFQARFGTEGGCRIVGGNILEASTAGIAAVGITEFTVSYVDDDGKPQQETFDEEFWGGGVQPLQLVYVNPPLTPGPAWPATGDDDPLLVIRPYHQTKDNLVAGAVIEIRGVDGQSHLMVDTSDLDELQSTWKDEGWQQAAHLGGVYVFELRQLRWFTPGRYQIHVYKRTAAVGTDLHLAHETFITLPPAGPMWWLNLPMQTTNSAFPGRVK